MNLKQWTLIAGIITGFCSVDAAAEVACPEGLICASKPETVAKAMQEGGFRAKLDKDKTGDPMISSEASGYEFDVFFYGCEKAKDCSSLQFHTSFVAEPDNTPAYANAWNSTKRFVQASVNDKQILQLSYDVSTIGGLNQVNFIDVTEWWSALLGDFAVFVKEQKALSTK